MARGISFGVIAPPHPFEEARGMVLEAERLGFDSFWLSDDLQGSLEPLTVLAALAVEAQKIRLGTCVVDAQCRHPASLAQAAATVDIVSGGRLILGVGTGGFGMEYGFARVQNPVQRMRETVEVVNRLWTEQQVDYSGTCYRIKAPGLEPRPVQKPHPPIWIAANSPRSLRVAAELGDGWLPMITSPEGYREDLETIGRHAATGREPHVEPALLLHTNVAQSREASREVFEPAVRQTLLWLSGRPVERLGYGRPRSVSEIPSEAVDRLYAYGSPEDCVSRLEEFVESGVRHFILLIQPQHLALENLRTYAEKIIPSIR